MTGFASTIPRGRRHGARRGSPQRRTTDIKRGAVPQCHLFSLGGLYLCRHRPPCGSPEAALRYSFDTGGSTPGVAECSALVIRSGMQESQAPATRA